MQLLIHMIILLLWRISTPASSSDQSAAPVAKPGCQSHCRHVSIPYPFGIGPSSDCYFNEWFQILCDNSTIPHKPLLINSKPRLEVMNIYIDGRIRVKNSVTIFSCKGKEIHLLAPNFTGSPFTYSQKYNRFIAASCAFFALVKSDNGRVVGGCMSTCDEGSKPHDCIGINCCQTTLPKFLTVITTELQSEFGSVPDCEKQTVPHNYAFLVEQEWFHQNNSRSIHDMGSTVPVVLRWTLSLDINSSSFKPFKKFIRATYSSYNNKPMDFELQRNHDDPTPYCKLYNTTSPTNNLPMLRCFCPVGFEKNPYLLKPCQDIDECKGYNPCTGAQPDYHPRLNTSEATCENLAGGYSCYSDGVRCDFYAGALALHNCHLIERGSKTSGSDRTEIIILGIGIGLGILSLLIGAWYAFKHIKERKIIKLKEMILKRNGRLLLEQQQLFGEVNLEKIKLFKSRELEKSTDNFSINRILGYGGQATVYKGMLADGRIVAIKKSKMVDECKRSEFINEVVILSQIKHRNVVKLLGCCLETEVPLLVYEFIPNGTLFQYIHEQNEEFPLTWEMRLQIAREVAGALSYLHATASCPIYHRDIKSSNILLDAKYRAKVADFGTSRSVAIDQTHLTTLVQGTFGYLDPEYFQSSKFTEKSDVYSFGIVLVELLTGQKPVSGVGSLGKEEYKSLATYFIMSMQENRLFDVVDARFLKEGSEREIIIVANLTKKCLNLNGKKRPSMREIITVLENIQMSKNCL